MTPSIGASAAHGSLAGSIAVPGPTRPSENTGSGTAPSPTTHPATGARTVVMWLPPGAGSGDEIVDLGGDRVGVRAHHDLDDVARGHDAVGSGGPQGGVVDPPGVPDLGAQTGDARFDVDDVARAAGKGGGERAGR